jgi:hypothetical protein
MGDIMSILQNAYASASLTTPSNTPYVNVDPASYQGTWDGTYSTGQKFQFSISQAADFARRSNISRARPFSTRAC